MLSVPQGGDGQEAPRPCVTSVHRHLIPVASKGAGHLVALVCLELRIWQDLARQKGLNVRSANGVYIQQEGNLVGTVNEAREAACTSPCVPGSWESLPFVFKGVPPWLLLSKAGAKDVRSSTVHRLCALTVTHHHHAIAALSYPGGDPTQVVETICKLGTEAYFFWEVYSAYRTSVKFLEVVATDM